MFETMIKNVKLSITQESQKLVCLNNKKETSYLKKYHRQIEAFL